MTRDSRVAPKKNRLTRAEKRNRAFERKGIRKLEKLLLSWQTTLRFHIVTAYPKWEADAAAFLYSMGVRASD